MRKYFNFGVIVMVMLTLCVNFSSCSKDDDEGDNGGGGGNPAIEGIVWETQIGTYNTNYYYFENGKWEELDIASFQGIYSYMPQGKYKYDIIFDETKFTLNGEKLMVYRYSGDQVISTYTCTKSTEFKTWKEVLKYAKENYTTYGDKIP